MRATPLTLGYIQRWRRHQDFPVMSRASHHPNMRQHQDLPLDEVSLTPLATELVY